MAYTLEKKLLTEFLQMYKDLQCLWNTSHALYSNKLARNRATSVLHEKYLKLDPTADQRKMKKKLENMRTTYKRERNKVMKSQINGDEELYEPSLWYYSEMTFLDELSDNQNHTETTELSVDASNDDGDGDDEERSESPPPLLSVKRSKSTSVYLTDSEMDCNDIIIKKTTPAKKAKISSVYLAEDDNDYQEEPSYSVKNEPSDVYAEPTSESDLFGKTIAAQLSELRPKQRFIAEKLISDVIFFGRLDKLKTGTTLNLSSDRF